jgi:hypothetical protein
VIIELSTRFMKDDSSSSCFVWPIAERSTTANFSLCQRCLRRRTLTSDSAVLTRWISGSTEDRAYPIRRVFDDH